MLSEITNNAHSELLKDKGFLSKISFICENWKFAKMAYLLI